MIKELNIFIQQCEECPFWTEASLIECDNDSTIQSLNHQCGAFLDDKGNFEKRYLNGTYDCPLTECGLSFKIRSI